ncbi:MAG: hypothetical protein JSU96_19310 [Acidobacteriota bacterium]|nr:MAG: hypothetical protein JSU96_19310 [Acidobacteriota bacterium]
MASKELKGWFEQLQRCRGRIAVLGTCKNAGKTTVLNAILKHGVSGTVGVTSIGRDGEPYDVVEKVAKPSISLESGTLFATASESLERSRGRWTVLAETSAVTPLGRVLIARAEQECTVELAGPSDVEGMRNVATLLEEAGAHAVYLDGAFDRVAAGSSRLADAVVLVVGSAGRSSIDEVISELKGYLNRYHLPEVSVPTDDQPDLLQLNALTDEQLPELEGRSVVLPDPSACLISPAAWRWVGRRKIQLHVRHQLKLEAIFLNTFRPHLSPLSAEALLNRVRELCQNVAVFDLKLEGWFDRAGAEN